MPPPSKWRTSQPYGGYKARTWFRQHHAPDVTHYSTPPQSELLDSNIQVQSLSTAQEKPTSIISCIYSSNSGQRVEGDFQTQDKTQKSEYS